MRAKSCSARLTAGVPKGTNNRGGRSEGCKRESSLTVIHCKGSSCIARFVVVSVRRGRFVVGILQAVPIARRGLIAKRCYRGRFNQFEYSRKDANS